MKNYTRHLELLPASVHNPPRRVKRLAVIAGLIGEDRLVCGQVAQVVEHPEEDRPPLVVGLEWSARITTVGFEIGVPTLAGWWLDRKLGTGGWVLIVGALLGVATGCLHLIQMTIALTKQCDLPCGPDRAKEEP